MIRAALAIGLAAVLGGCSEPIETRDIPGVYTGTLGEGATYRLEMGEDMRYRFCRAEDADCTPPEDRGAYQVVRLGSTSIVRFSLLCAPFGGDCRNYEADARLRRPGSVEIAFVDEAGKEHVFVKQH
ncbi:hypothetical protein KYN89_10755 [Alteriqipengyuania sp. NZ-12B]|uniref:Lipoprotein n=1 Tax=Alteriqipengyuania abyssalis TaxID=2860200 RepID=A0ABS7PEM6_9SPHN|nr:hypothetical protein [Alteriqipengyuania abyssalis]MBY8337531.1 hypothetical protein [Alteriqipengyuania abyssalis]